MDTSCDDLQLTLTAGGNGASGRVTLERLPFAALIAAETVSLAGWPRLEAEFLRPLQNFVDQPLAPAFLAELGSYLASLLLPPLIRAGLETELNSRPEHLSALEPLRLRLVFEPTALANAPWEFVHCGEASGPNVKPAILFGFLGLHPRLHLIRQVTASRQSDKTPLPVSKLRVLVVSSDPCAPGYPALPHLQAEADSVAAALQAPECRGLTVKALANATPAVLARILREWQPHVLHLIGHGDVRPSGGVLVLQGERDGTAALVYGDELAGWLAETPARLVVLSACSTASSVQGPAQALARAGIPAVVAMQMPLRDAAAGPFSRAFYAALREALPVEQALAEARRAVAGMGPDWGVPVLYLQTDTGALFLPAAAPLPPASLPYRPSETFVGRDSLLQTLHHSLFREKRSAALVGMGGLGKTQIAVQYAHAHRQDYPGGVFWVSGRQITAEMASLAYRFFGAPAEWTTEEAADWASDSLMRQPEPTLLVCDGITEETEVQRLPAAGNCRVLVTTREGYLVRSRFRVFPVPALDDESAWALLQIHETAAGPDEEAAVHQIAALLGSLPLALALVAHHVHRLGLGFAAYHTRLQSAPFEALQQARRRFLAGTGHDGALYDALQLSFGSLTPPARRVLSVAAAFAARGISTALLAEACGSASGAEFEEIEFEEAVADLVDSSWMIREEEPRLTIHELVRRFAWEQQSPAEQCEAAAQVARILQARLTAARDADDWRSVRLEISHCESAARRCRELSLPEPLLSLLPLLAESALTHGELPAARRHCDEGLALLAEAELLPASHESEAAFFLMLRAEARQQQGEKIEALQDARGALRHARRFFRPDDPALIDYYNVLGIALKKQDKSRCASALYFRALALARRAYGRRHPTVARCLNNIGTLYESLGEHKSAQTYLSRALIIARGTDTVLLPTSATYLDNLGRVLGLQGRWEEALRCHQEALHLNEAAFSRQHPHAAASLYYTAQSEAALNDSAPARAHFAEALRLYEYFYGSSSDYCGIVRAGLARLPPE